MSWWGWVIVSVLGVVFVLAGVQSLRELDEQYERKMRLLEGRCADCGINLRIKNDS